MDAMQQTLNRMVIDSLRQVRGWNQQKQALLFDQHLNAMMMLQIDAPSHIPPSGRITAAYAHSCGASPQALRSAASVNAFLAGRLACAHDPVTCSSASNCDCVVSPSAPSFSFLVPIFGSILYWLLSWAHDVSCKMYSSQEMRLFR
jgi:hypothetical protein